METVDRGALCEVLKKRFGKTYHLKDIISSGDEIVRFIDRCFGEQALDVTRAERACDQVFKENQELRHVILRLIQERTDKNEDLEALGRRVGHLAKCVVGLKRALKDYPAAVQLRRKSWMAESDLIKQALAETRQPIDTDRAEVQTTAVRLE